MADKGPGDARSIDNPTEATDMPDELEAPVRSDADREPVEGETADDAGAGGERVSKPGDGLVTEEGVNERETRSP